MNDQKESEALEQFDEIEEVILNKYDGRVTQSISKIFDKYLLMWNFDPLEDNAPLLFITLNEDEVKKIAEADWRVGLIEPVRSTLENVFAIISFSKSLEKEFDVEIPREGTEEEFAEFILSKIEEFKNS